MTTPATSETYEAISLDEFRKTKDSANLVSWVNEKHKKLRDDRAKNERQWYINLAFYFGHQNVSPIPINNGTGTRLIVPTAPPWRVRLIINKIRPIVRTELAKFIAQKPTWVITPATSDDEDIMAARAGEGLFDSYYRQENFDHVLTRSLFWTATCGTGFIKDYYDKDQADPITGQKGRIITEPVTPFHLFVPDLKEELIENQPYIIHVSTKSPDWVRMRYKQNVEGKEVKPNAKSLDVLESSFLNMLGIQQNTPDSVLCLEVWIRPGQVEVLPEGGFFTVADGQLLEAVEGWPYQHGEYPFTKIDHLPTGVFYGDSVIKDLIPLQREYNRTISQIIESKNRMSKPQIIAAKGSVNPKKITTEPGQVVEYELGFPKPEPLVLQNLPQYVLQQLDRIQNDMDDISGQHEITRGSTPPQVTAATAITYLQEQDDSKLSHTIRAIERGISKIGRHVLSHAQPYWNTERVIKIIGTDGSFDTLIFKGSDLKGNTDLAVEAGSALPTSKAARQAFLMDLMKNGFLDPQKGMEYLQIGGLNKLWQDLQIDIRQVQRENLRMQRGMQEDPNDWDNHALHLEYHNKFRKSQTFEMLPDEVKRIFQAHVGIHQMAVQQQQQAAMMMQGGMPPQEQPPLTQEAEISG